MTNCGLQIRFKWRSELFISWAHFASNWLACYFCNDERKFLPYSGTNTVINSIVTFFIYRCMKTEDSIYLVFQRSIYQPFIIIPLIHRIFVHITYDYIIYIFSFLLLFVDVTRKARTVILQCNTTIITPCAHRYH